MELDKNITYRFNNMSYAQSDCYKTSQNFWANGRI